KEGAKSLRGLRTQRVNAFIGYIARSDEQRRSSRLEDIKLDDDLPEARSAHGDCFSFKGELHSEKVVKVGAFAMKSTPAGQAVVVMQSPSR
ncbi:MAG: hypothetical protein Q9204_009014, partial [Flavoplaca sp. TL-2023a]